MAIPGARWEVLDEATQVLDAAGVPATQVSCEPAQWTFRYDGPPADVLDLFRRYYGPTMNAFDAAEKAGKADRLAAELTNLFEDQNSGDSDRTEIGATYLQVRVAVL